VTPVDTGQRRRSTDVRPLISRLLDETTVAAVAEQTWTALVGEDEVLVPLRGGGPVGALSAWVDIVGPWTGSVVLTTGRDTAADLSRALLREGAPRPVEEEDVADAFGELANVVGGNVKAALPGPSALGLPEVGEGPPVGDPADVVRIDVLWRGRPLAITVQGAPAPLPVSTRTAQGTEVPL
jgi:hypothetical protein